MTRGYPDWATQGKAPYTKGQEPWYGTEEGNIAGSSHADYIDYTVPAKRRLHLTSGLVCCNFPCLQRVALNWSPALTGTITYDTIFALPLHPAASHVIGPGNTVYVRVYNDDGDQHYFTVTLIGFLETIEE